MELIDVIKSRRSVRNYKSEKIPRDILANIIDCARLAPSANNIQPWEFIVVTESDMLKNIAGLTKHGKFLERAAACIIVCSKDTKYYLEDCSAATENILLAAHAYGLGGCWVAADKHDYVEELKKLLHIPEKYKVVSLVALGYPADDTPRPAKRSLKDVLHWERW